MISRTYISISDTKLFTVTKGEGFPLFVLHGEPGLDHHAFGDYLDDLANDYKLIFVDQRGQGQSEEVDFKTLTTKRMAKDILELARELSFEEYGIIGHSYGTFVALQHGVDFPNVAKCIVLLGAASSGIEVQRFVESNYLEIPLLLRERIRKAQVDFQSAKTRKAFQKAWTEYTAFYFSYPTNEDILKEFSHQTQDINIRFDILNYSQKTDYGYYNVSNDLFKVKSPVLLLAGDQDNICSLEGHINLNNKLPNSRLVTFKTGHMIFAENNTKFLKEVRAFVKENIH